MSRFEVNLTDSKPENSPKSVKTSMFSAHTEPEKPNIFFKVLKILGILLAVFVVIGGIGGFLYWQNLKKSPQYSLALLVDAARNNDQAKVDELVDTDAVVDDFLPQITDKAVELYGRNLPPEKIKQVAKVIAPILPSVKERAKAELPNLIREKTEAFNNIPFWAIAVGANRYLEITQDGDKAFIKSKIQSRPIELTMKRNAGKWQVVAVKDEVLAQRIAEKVGQEIILIVQKNGANSLRDAGKNLGVENVKDLLKKAEDIFK
jgi:hypothetical protein